MPVLPIHMIIALVLAGFLAYRIIKRETHATVLALIAVCAMQSCIIALVQYYGVTVLRPVQAVLATVIPPVAWIAFSRASSSENQSNTWAWHGIGPALSLLCVALSPLLLDVLIPLSFAAYGVGMLLKLSGGEDNLLHSRLESGAGAVVAWRTLALALFASAVCDVAITYSLAAGQTGVLQWLPSIVSSLSLLGLGVVSLAPAIESRREPDLEPQESASSMEDLQRDKAIITKLDEFVLKHRPHLDPDLTLARLARKLTLPAKQLSAAINRGKDENVSRYINRLRISQACQLMTEGKSVTTAMYESGFNTKSNFNREFFRVKGMSPRQWQAENHPREAVSLTGH